VEYEANYRETGRWLRRSDELREACEEAAGDIADIAVAIAPVRTGAYVESIQVLYMSGTDRVGAGVEADDEAAAPLEFGNVRMKVGRHLLLTAALAAGFDVRDE
jgi:uncharacterized RmlC-like cupin family protein